MHLLRIQSISHKYLALINKAEIKKLHNCDKMVVTDWVSQERLNVIRTPRSHRSRPLGTPGLPLSDVGAVSCMPAGPASLPLPPFLLLVIHPTCHELDNLLAHPFNRCTLQVRRNGDYTIPNCST